MKYLILIIIAIIISLSTNYVMGQCDVTGSASSTSITCGECVYLSAFGQGQGQTIFSENFNSGTYGAGWSSSSQAMWNNPCSASGVDGTTHIWMGNSSPVPRILATQAYNLSGAPAGASICFDMLLAEQGNAAPCEGPDEPQEGIYVQYSIDGGANWINIHYFDPNGGYDPQFINWNNWCFNLPAGAMTASTMFRWFQDNDSGADYDHWGIDNVNIYFNDPTYQIIWQHDGYNLGAVGGTNPNPVCPKVTTTYTVEMSNGTSTCTDNVTINVALPNIVVSANPDTSLCTGACTDLQGVAKVIVKPAKTPTYENNELATVTSGNATVGINITDLNMTQVLPNSITSVCINSFSYNSAFAVCTNMSGCTNCDGTTANWLSNYSVCAGSFNVILHSPNGCQITLVPEFEASGNYPSGVCFIPSGGQSISDPSFPAAGNWTPNEPFSNLVGCDANGVWTMEFDAPGGASFGAGFLSGWSITFDDPEISYIGNYTWSPTTDMTNSNSLTPNVCPSSNIVYTLEVSDTAGCSTVSDAVTVNVGPCTFNATVNSATICPGDCANITATISSGTPPYTYTWNPGTLSGAGPHNVCPAGTTTYYVTVTDAALNSATASGTVTVNTPSTVDAGNNVAICNGNNTTLTASGASSYVWDNGLGTGTSHVVSPSSSTTYTVTGTDANGCTDTDQVTVTVNNSPTPTITGSLTFCSGFSTTLDAGSGYSSYLWTGGSTLQSLVVNSAGTYYVTVTDGNGCSGTTSAVVTQSSTLSPSISGILAICSSNATTLDAGSGYADYLWSPGGATTQTISASATGTYSVTVSDGGGCTGTASVNVNAYSNPTPSIAGSNSFCFGDTITLDAGAGYSSYNWLPAATAQTYTVTVGGNYAVTVTDANGCSGTDAVTVTAYPGVTLSFGGGVTDFCSGDTVVVDAGPGFVSYDWSNGDNTQIVYLTTGGTYIVSVTDANGCGDTSAISLNEHISPVPDVTGNLSFCQGDSSLLDAGAGFNSYLWFTPNYETTQSIYVLYSGVYYVVVNDAFGCYGIDSAEVTVNPKPMPAISGNLAFCKGANTTLDAGSGYNSYLWSPGGEVSQSITVTSPGTYSVTVSDNIGCVGNDVIDVIEYAGIDLSFAGGPIDFCSGDTIVIDAGAGLVSYDWSNGDSTQVVYLTTGGVYIVTVTDANGCTDTAGVTLNEHISPVPDITGNLSFCQGDSSLLDAGAGFNSYLWFTTNYETTQTIYAFYSGVYYVVVDDSYGCYGVDSVVVDVIANPVPILNIVDPPCFEDDATVSVSNVSALATYSWNFSGGVAIPGDGAGPHSVSWASAGNYTVSVTVTDNGCSGVASANANVPDQLIIDSTSKTDALCYGANSGSISVVASGGTGQLLYSISGPTQTNGIFSNLAAGNYIVTISDANSCSISTNQITISQPMALTLSVNTGDSICAGEIYNIIATCNGGTLPYTYTWKDGSGNIIGGNNSSINVSPNNSSNYSVYVVDANNCTIGPKISILKVSPPVTVSYIVDNVSCKGSCDGKVTFSFNGGMPPFTLTGTTWVSTNNIKTDLCAGTYPVNIKDSWGCPDTNMSFIITEPLALAYTKDSVQTKCAGSFDGIAYANIISGTGTAPYEYIWSNGSTSDSLVTGAGVYWFTVSDAHNCTVTDTIVIGQPSQVILTINSHSERICKGQSITIDASNGAFGGTPPYSYSWIWVSPEDSITHTSSSQSLLASPNYTTNYSLSAHDSHGCLSSASANITVKVNPPITAELFPSKLTICPGDSVLIKSSISGGNDGPYFCTLQDGTVVTEDFYVYPKGQDTSISYSFTAKDLCGSPAGTDNFTIRILALPPVSLFADTLFGCQPLMVSFMDSSKFIGQTYFWTFTNTDANINSFSYSKYPEINFTEPGTYDVTIITTSIEGCHDSLTKPEMITVYPNPQSEFTVDPQVQSKINPIFYFQNLSSTTYLCSWDFGDDIVSNEINPVHTYQKIPGNYLVQLTVETENGCTNTSSNTVIVKDEYTLFAPTAFSPDNDGVNDIFFISGSGIDPNFYHLIIYDRWGEIVFESNSFNPENPKQYGWDGKIKGKSKSEVGTYTWYCIYKNLNGEERQEAGPVTIIR